MSNPSNIIHPQTTLGEVKLKVSNLQRAITFYQEVIGFKILQEAADTVWLTADGATALLVLEEIPQAIKVPPRSTTGLYHFAILLSNRKELSLALQNLIDHNIRIGQADHIVSEALYLSDPDGNGIEIYCDRPRESWRRDAEGNYVMASNAIDWEGLLAEAGDEQWKGLSSGTLIGHIHLHVGDIAKSRAFYVGLLGFGIVGDYTAEMRALFVSAGGYHHHIGLNTWAGVGAPPSPANAAGLAYYTIVFPDQEELERCRKHLANNGVSVNEREGAWFVQDPSGVNIRLIAG